MSHNREHFVLGCIRFFFLVQGFNQTILKERVQTKIPIEINKTLTKTAIKFSSKGNSWTRSLQLQEDKPVKVWLKGYSKPLLLAKQVFKNKDKSTGILYLVASDLTASYSCMTIAYQRRWAVETYHRSLKNNTSVCASPTNTIKTQCNHIYASVMAFVKLEVISIKKAVSQYALKSQVYLKGIQTAFDELKYYQIWCPIRLRFLTFA